MSVKAMALRSVALALMVLLVAKLTWGPGTARKRVALAASRMLV